MLGWFKKKKVQKDAPVIPEENTSGELDTENIENDTADAPLQGTGIFGSSLERSEDIESSQDDAAQEKKPPEDTPITAKPPSLIGKLAMKLSRTRESLVQQMDNLFLGKKEIDVELLDDLEELLITADIGAATAVELIDYARKKVKRAELSDPASLKKFIKERLRSYIADTTRPAELVMPDTGPFVIMVVGVNGVGKTTTIGKIAHKFLNSGQTVLLAAADTFRAAAVSQLKIWGERSGIEVVCKDEGADPSSVAFDAVAKAVDENYDVILVDTAGRLHTQTNLMEELKKIKRVIGKKLEGAPHEILLVLDATTGQNGISQAKLFNEAVGVTGLALTKLDGTAKGGIVANISRYMDIPIRFIGVGEKIDDLRDFDPDEFIEALFHEKS
ncbi:MAG: signal recognition particle-docking protein FtsY [Desulfopila sp.]|jgi:fused signal recognition particle receptor|nr:signal recognition particle-docking protein FtsY [Desulfopila sp.]